MTEIPPRRPLTLRDVSEAAGVSEMTVSRVLRGRDDVSDATRAKVLEAAERLGYVPNKIAGALASSHVNLVAVVVPSLSNMVFPEVLSGISEVLDGTPLQPVFGVTGYRPEKEERVLYEMLSWRPSGVIVAGLDHTPAAREMLAASGIPVVEIMDTDGEAVDAVVGISHRRAGRLTGEAIAERGYEKVAFAGTKMPLDRRARKRFEGFTAAMGRAGIEIVDQEFYEGGSALLTGREMTQALINRRPDLDMIYYSNDMIGAGGLLWCLDHRIEVGARVGLAGFNGVELLAGLPRRLATMDAMRREIGREAARIVLARHGAAGADTAEPPGARVELTPRFEVGETLRAPS